MEFTKVQRQAVEHFIGPMAVVAGPGSGKTAVITERIVHLTANHQVTPGSILVLTFTKAAAAEMSARFCRISGIGINMPVFGTFHSVFYNILSKSTGMSYSIISESKKMQLIISELNRFNIDPDKTEEITASISSAVSKIKNCGLKNIDLTSFSLTEEEFKTIVSGYTKVMRSSGYIDYDDILLYTFDILKRQPDILKKWQDRFKYILIDEFQDINPLQYNIIKLIAAPENNIFIVGDDDQSIYSFRGSDSSVFRRFIDDFNCKNVVLLDTNFRCGPSIVKNSSLLISHNRGRISKQLNSHFNYKDLFSIIRYNDYEDEQKDLIRCICDIHSAGTAYSEIAVLVRNRHDGLRLARGFSEHGLPVMMNIKQPVIENQMFDTDIRSYFLCSFNTCDAKAYAKIINRPDRSISGNSLTLGTEGNVFEAMLGYYKNNPHMISKIEAFKVKMLFLSKLNSYLGLQYIFNALEYRKYIDSYISEYPEYKKEAEESILRLRKLAIKYPLPSAFVKEINNVSPTPPDTFNRSGIRILSMHASKGLEFDTVFIPGMNKGTIPASKAKKPEEIEEERRLLYVAMTRAKKRLQLSYVQNINNKNSDMSVFISELLQK